MKKILFIIAALTLSAGLWAENPSVPPTGPIIYEDLLFQADGNETVILVEKKDTDPKYSGDIVVPEGFEFKDSQERLYTFRVTEIGANAFKGCSITSVTLPASIESIGDNAFANCEQLTSVTCLGTEPATLGEDVFAGDALTIYVPIWTKDAYEENWSEYEGFISLTELDQTKEDALVTIQAARQGIQNTEINMMINDAVNSISSATTEEQIKDAQFKAMTIIGLFQNGKEEAKEELLGAMGEECTGCTAVEVTDGTTTVTLYNATNVGYIKK